MKILAFDIEADGLLLAATTIHCGVVEDIETGERHEFTDPTKLYHHLLTADRLVAHNGRMYDCPMLERLVGRPNDLPTLPPCLDTLLISRLLWPDKGNTPAGGHSLEKWGEFLGSKKLHTDIEDWSIYTTEMLERCGSDVSVQVRLYKYLIPKLSGWGQSVQLEHTVATIIAKQIENGFPINMDKVDALEMDLLSNRAEEMDKLGDIPAWVEEKELKSPAYWSDPLDGERWPTKGAAPSKVRGRLERGPNKIKRTEIPFNPNSGDHIRRLFKEKYQWEGLVIGKNRDGSPRIETTDSGLPSVKESVLSKLPYHEAQSLATISKITKILSFVNGYREYAVDERIHGSLITNGTVAGRMSHSSPNMGQNPAANTEEILLPSGEKKEVPIWGRRGGWGIDCRDLFESREGWVLVGMDAKGLEGRMLGNRVAEYDGGAYASMLETSDIHSVNQKLAGLPTRKESKTFYFKFVYGGKTPKDLEAKMYESCPGLKKLKEDVINHAIQHGYVVCLDGRRVPVRKRPLYGNERTEEEKRSRKWGVAVNNILQGDGAVVMKKALDIFYHDAVDKYGPHGLRWALCANVHDEFQFECEPEIAEDLGQMACDAVTKAGEFFNMSIRLEGEYKVGKSWAETH
jgi:hypothetical protein